MAKRESNGMHNRPETEEDTRNRLMRGPQPDDSAENIQPEDPDPWRHRSTMMKCRTCMAFVVKERDKRPGDGFLIHLGRCRRHAPTMEGYPPVYENDWCLDHKIDENKA